MECTVCRNRISRVFTTRPCRSVSFRCYDEKYYFCCLICLKILLFYLEQMVCLLQRRAESPIRIQPRAAPWVKRFQQTCALKEQKEGERTSISLAPVALTARQLVNEHTPRVLPWAVFLLGLRPVLALNRGYCTSSWVIFFLELRPVCARNIGCCTLRWAIFPLGLRPVLARNHCCCTLRWVISLSGLRPLIACIVAAVRCHIYHYNLV